MKNAPTRKPRKPRQACSVTELHAWNPTICKIFRSRCTEQETPALSRCGLKAIDSVTYDDLARFAPQEVAGLRIVTHSAPSPTLAYIGSLQLSDEQVAQIRQAMNLALQDLPQVVETLGIQTVYPPAKTTTRCCWTTSKKPPTPATRTCTERTHAERWSDQLYKNTF